HMPVTLFVNGAQIGRFPINNWQGMPATAGDFYFGTDPDGSQNAPQFAGLLDEVALYQRALASSEISTLYNVGHNGKCPVLPHFLATPASPISVTDGNDLVLRVPVAGTSLTFKWRFDDGSGNWQEVGPNQPRYSFAPARESDNGTYKLE